MMHKKVPLYSSIILLFFVVSFTHGTSMSENQTSGQTWLAGQVQAQFQEQIQKMVLANNQTMTQGQAQEEVQMNIDSGLHSNISTQIQIQIEQEFQNQNLNQLLADIQAQIMAQIKQQLLDSGWGDILGLSADTTTTTTTTTPAPATTTSTAPATTTTPAPVGQSQKSKNKYNSQYNYNSQDGYDGYNDNKYGNSDDNGMDSGKYGGSNSGPKRSMLSSLDIWITSAEDWEQNKQPKYNGRGRGNDGNNKKYNKDKNYGGKDDKNYGGKDDNYNDGYQKKHSSSKVRFPVKQIPNYRRLPLGRLPPLLSIMPWLPIFYDELTYQTFIFSPTGGIYIIPPLINFYGQRFAVAQLIKWGYASLVSSGAPPPPNVDVAPLVAPPPAAGGVVTAGVVGSPSAAPAPTYDEKKHRFRDGVKTDFPTFKARYSQTLDEGDNRSYGPSSGKNYGSGSNYGGTGNQEVNSQGSNQQGAYGY